MLAGSQSNDLQGRIKFAEALISTLARFNIVFSELQNIIKSTDFSDQAGLVSSFRLPSALKLSLACVDEEKFRVDASLFPLLSLTDYVCKFSVELMAEVIQHPIFKLALEDNPALAHISDSPVLKFDRAIYSIDLGNCDKTLVLDRPFPPSPVAPSVENGSYSNEEVFIDPSGSTSAIVELDGHMKVCVIVATRPFVSEFREENGNIINKFFQEKILCLIQLLETQTLIIRRLSEYYSSVFESSVHLLQRQEDLRPFLLDEIDA